MNIDVIKAINNFDKLNQKFKPITIDIIEWWLFKHSALYKKTYESVYNQHLFTTDDDSVIRLPPFGKLTDQDFFLDLYEALDTISKFHRNEKYFKQEMVTYNKIKHSHSNLKNWIAKNEDFGAEKYVSFLIDYLDYDENDEEEHLSVYVHSLKELEIYVDRHNFKNTIDFLEKFNELYWTNENATEIKTEKL